MNHPGDADLYGNFGDIQLLCDIGAIHPFTKQPIDRGRGCRLFPKTLHFALRLDGTILIALWFHFLNREPELLHRLAGTNFVLLPSHLIVLVFCFSNTCHKWRGWSHCLVRLRHLPALSRRTHPLSASKSTSPYSSSSPCQQMHDSLVGRPQPILHQFELAGKQMLKALIVHDQHNQVRTFNSDL